MAKLMWKNNVEVDLRALKHSRLPTYLFSMDILELHGWGRPLQLNPRAADFLPITHPTFDVVTTSSLVAPSKIVTQPSIPTAFFHKPIMNPNFRNPQVARNINANQSAFPQQKRINANHSALPQQRRINTNQSVFPQKTAFTHDPYAEEMSDHNSHGRQAMDILKEKLANEDALENNQNNNDIGEQNVNHACPTMPAMGPNSHALQAPFPDKRDTTGSSGFVISQPVQYDVFTSAPNVTNGLYQGFSASQQQGEYQNTMRNSHNGALTIMAPAFTDGHIGRDVFSNDHLSSEIVPLEDPAEAFALSQSIVPIELRNRRSRQLNLLTCGPNQCPTAAVGLHADNFPFVEGARLAQATPAYGVIRLRGVSYGPSSLFPKNETEADQVIMIRSLRPPVAARSWPSWAATPKS